MIELFLKLKKLPSIEKVLLFLIFVLGIFLIFFGIKQNLFLKPKYGGIYKEAVFEPIENLNLFSFQNETQRAIINIIYPSLIEFDNGKLISKFIKNYYVSSDSLTYTFELKDNLKWSDGHPLTSDDVINGFKALKKFAPLEINNLFKDIEIKKIDQKKFEFTLKSNDNYFLYNLRYLKPLPRQDFPNEFDENLLKIGSGPFVFEKLVKNNITYLVLKRNEYYQPRPYLEKLIFYYYPSPKRAFDALLLKEVDGVSGLNYFNLPANIFYHYNIYQITLPRVIGLFFNSQKTEKELSSFIEKDLDRSYLVKNIFQGYAEESQGLYSPSVRKILKIKNLTIQKPEVTKKEFGKIILTSPNFYFYPDLARYFRDKFGFEIELVDNNTLNEKIQNKDYQILLLGINYGHPPAIFYFWSRAGLFINNTENLDLEKNFQKLIIDPKINFSEELFNLEEKILKTNLNIFLLNPKYIFILSKNIVGFDQYYLLTPEEKFVKIEHWFKK